jgi:ribose-phosphate pyrophosphokinase
MQGHPSPAAVFAFPRQADLGRRLARRLGQAYRTVRLRSFPDGESLVRLPAQPWRGPATLLCSLDDPNRRLVECLLALATLRERGARPVTLLAPYLGYMRQDVAFHPGEAVSQRIVLEVLGRHVDRLVTVDAHLHRTHDLAPLLGRPARNLAATAALARRLRAWPRPLLVGPDEESEPWVESLARAAGATFLVGRKRRTGDARVRVRLPDVGPLRGQTAVIVDDIVSTGHTAAEAARALRPHGPAAIVLLAVHAIFAPGAEALVRAAGVREVVTTNSVPHATNEVDLAPLLAEALRARPEED